jgi:multiple sugar transport system permease protein
LHIAPRGAGNGPRNCELLQVTEDAISVSTIALPESPPGHVKQARKPWSTWQTWGLLLLTPYILVFLAFVVYPVGYGLWLARHPASYHALAEDPIFLRTILNTVAFVLIAINVKMAVALFLSGFFVMQRTWIKWLSLLFILPWAVPSIPTILSFRFMLNPEWGLINSLIFRYTGADGPNWLNDPILALGIAMLVHIWKSLPFWTLILIAGRLAIPAEHYEAASVDGATTWQKFKFITWPSMRTLYITCTLLSMIWTLGDFNSVYLLTGGGPADLTHVLATLGIRYLRLDQIDLSMAAIVCTMPLVLPMVYFMMKRLSK